MPLYSSKFATIVAVVFIFKEINIIDTSLQESFTKVDASLEQHLSECIFDVVETYFNPDLPFTIQTPGTWAMASPDITSHLKDSNGNGDILFKIFNRYYFIPYVTLGYPFYYEIPHHKRVKPSSHLILVSAKNVLSTIQVAIHMINRVYYRTRNDAARTVIAVIDPIQKYDDRIPLVQAILEMAWQVSLLTNVIVIITIEVQSDVYYFDIFGWTPEDEENNICEMEVEVVKFLGRYTSNYRRIILSNIFPSKQLRDMRNCLLKIDIFLNFPYTTISNNHVYGIFITLIETAAKIMNFTMEFKMNQYVHTSAMDIAVWYNEFEEFPFTYPYIKSVLAWHVPSGKHIPLWQSVFKVFNSTTWILIGLTFICGTLTFWFLGILSKFKHVHMETRLTVVFLYSILTHLGMGVPDRYHGSVAVMFFMLWLGYCLQIYTLYQSSFTGHIINPKELPHIKTEKELWQSNLQIFSWINIYYDNVKYNQFPMCEDQDFECFDRLAYKKDIAVLSDRLIAQIYLGNRYSKTGKPEFVALEEEIRSAYFSILIRKIGCMLHDRLNSIQDRLFQSGTLTRYLDEAYYDMAKNYTKNINRRTVISFKISHLQGPFFLLIIGLLIGFIVFCLELFFNYIFTCRPTKKLTFFKTCLDIAIRNQSCS